MEGIITKTLGGFFFVKVKNNIMRCRIRGKIQKTIYPGDHVIVDIDNEIVVDLKDRKNLLDRPKVANIDQVLILHSLKEPPLDFNLLDRFILMAESSGLIPIVVFNKIDLVNNLDSIKEELNIYGKIGYDIFYISAKKHLGLDKLYEELKNSLSVIAGPSGSGKSTLINSIVDDVKLPTKDVSKKSKRGVHTTRHVELIPLKRNGFVVDTPGFTNIDIRDVTSDNLKYYFPEFENYNGKCKFSTCSHTHEPGCAVKKALKRDEISKKRFLNYKKIYSELKEKEEDFYG
ncbi:MAG: ribosome small subunit-dependent GTPase A [Halanaerobiales bacterium]|nr:ribosome small subunit-dependent GTPase A [Halanaerobiales bacterium]